MEEPWWVKTFRPEFYYRLEGFPNEQSTVCQVDFIIKALSLPPGAKVLDIGCGIGRHSIELSKRSLWVLGVDYSHAFLLTARQKAGHMKNSCFVQADMRKLPIHCNTFQGVIIMQNTFGMFEHEDNLRVLREVGNCLAPKGRLLIDIQNREYIAAMFSQGSLRTVKKDAQGIQEWEEWFDEDTSQSFARVLLKDSRGQLLESLEYRWREYSLSEMRAMLDSCGFEVITVYGSVSGFAFESISPKMITLARWIG